MYIYSTREVKIVLIFLVFSSSCMKTITSSINYKKGHPKISKLPKEKIRKTRNMSKKKKNKKEMMNVVQNLYQTCQEVFANGNQTAVYIPPPPDIERLKSVLGKDILTIDSLSRLVL